MPSHNTISLHHQLFNMHPTTTLHANTMSFRQYLFPKRISLCLQIISCLLFLHLLLLHWSWLLCCWLRLALASSHSLSSRFFQLGYAAGQCLQALSIAINNDGTCWTSPRKESTFMMVSFSSDERCFPLFSNLDIRSYRVALYAWITVCYL